jgi:peroxiredoxin
LKWQRAIVVLLGLWPTGLSAQDPQPSADPTAQFERLEEQMSQAYDEYVEAVRKRMEARAEREPSTKQEPPEALAEPLDGRIEVLRKMDQLAEQTAGQPVGEEIAVKTFVWSAAFRLDEKNLAARFDRIAEFYPKAEGLAEAVALVPDVYSLSGAPDRWTARLEAIAAAATDQAVKLAAYYATGRLNLSEKKLRPAKVAFERVIEIDADSEEANTARGYIHEIEHLQPGMTGPDFSATTLQGARIALQDFRGKVVLLDFWASWCAPCLSETPHLKAAAARFQDRPFVILGVSLDDAREMLEAVVQQRELPGVHTWDESGRDNPIAELYNAQVLPTWYLIDHDGVIRRRDPFGEQLIPAVEELLRKIDSAPQPPRPAQPPPPAEQPK